MIGASQNRQKSAGLSRCHYSVVSTKAYNFRVEEMFGVKPEQARTQGVVDASIGIIWLSQKWPRLPFARGLWGKPDWAGLLVVQPMLRAYQSDHLIAYWSRVAPMGKEGPVFVLF